MVDGFGDFLDRVAHEVLPYEEVVALAHRVADGQNAVEVLDRGAVSDAEERRRLIRLAESGHDARNELVRHNLRLVLSICSRYRAEGLTADDLFQEGVIGLVRAAEKFDPGIGTQFSTYATWWIRQSVQRAIADKARLIRLPVHIHDDLQKVVRARDTLLKTTGRASFDDLVEATGLQPSKVRDLLKLAPGTASLDELIGDGLTTLGDLQVDASGPRPEDIVNRAVLKEEIDRALDELTPREREVMRLRYGLEDGEIRTLEQVGIEFGVTRERIRQIESKTLEKLRHPTRTRVLREFMPGSEA